MQSSRDCRYRPELPADIAGIFEVHRQAFGREAESRLVDALRGEGFSRISQVAEIDGRIIGHVLFGVTWIESRARSTEALSLAPLGVLPDFQLRGIGSELLRQGLSACKQEGHRLALVLGDPHFYRRFGFSSELARSLDPPFPRDSFMALELVAGAFQNVAGKVRYPRPFDDL